MSRAKVLLRVSCLKIYLSRTISTTATFSGLGRAALHIAFQRKTTLSLKTKNRSVNFAILHYIDKIPPIYNIAGIFAHKRSVQKPKLLLRLKSINANSLYCSLRLAALRLHRIVRNIQTTPQSSQ